MSRCKSVSREQRNRVNFLSLMYKTSKGQLLNIYFPRNTRESKRIVLKLEHLAFLHTAHSDSNSFFYMAESL